MLYTIIVVVIMVSVSGVLFSGVFSVSPILEVCLLSSLCSPLLCCSVSTMDRIHELDIDCNAPTSEYRPFLVSLPLHTLLSVREELFLSAASYGLTADGNVLVSRRDTRKNTLCHKLADDIISLIVCLKNNSTVPRILLKNGKRRRDYLDSSRLSEFAANFQQEPPPMASLSSHPDAPRPAVPTSVSEAVRFSSVMKEVNMLRSDVEGPKREASSQSRDNQSQPSSAFDTCHVKVYFPSLTSPDLTPVDVSRFLGCPVLLVSSISAKSIIVKIPQISLFDSLQSSDPTLHLVYVWKNQVTRHPTTSSHHLPSSQRLDSIQIATWNCRGLHNSISYVKHLLSRGVDILWCCRSTGSGHLS